MGYYKTDQFARMVKNQHEEFLPGIYNQNKHKIIDFKEEVKLPINEGSERWWRFTVRLNSLMVLASYEAPGFDEDPQIVGLVKKDGASSVLNAKPTSSSIEVGKLKSIDVEVMNIHTLKLLPHSAEIFVGAVDTSNDLTQDIIDEIRATSSQFLNSAAALIPYGSKANRIAQQALKKLFEEIGEPKEIGNPYYVFRVPHKQFWKRKPEDHIWHRFKFIAFVQENPDDKDTPHDEIYLTMWELKLESEKAVIGEATETPPPKDKSSLKTIETEKKENNKKINKEKTNNKVKKVKK